MNTSEIVKALTKASEAYYNTGGSIMTDEEFDSLKNKLKELDPDNEFLKQVGSPVPKHLSKMEHKIPMGSLNNCTTEGNKSNPSFQEWYNKVGQPEVCVMHKLDGSSIELIYKKGELKHAITRGDGKTGEVITQNARKFKGVLSTLNKEFSGSIRGEAVLLLKDFKEHFEGTANPRNAANGTVRRTDGSKAEHITFIAFDILGDFETHSEKLHYIKELGLKPVWNHLSDSADDIIKDHKYVSETRMTIPYEIDGMVILVNNCQDLEELGEKDHRPKGGIAYKFECEGATTRLVSVKLSMGSTGAIIPTADLEPVQIGGVTVSSALLNNYEEIERLDLHVNDMVNVVRRGDVIPKVESVAVKAADREKIEPPEVCWECGCEIVKDGAIHFCKNPTCTGKKFQLLKHWVTKRNILHIGDELLMTLYKDYGVKTPDDLYTMDEDVLANVPRGNGIVGSNAKRIMAEINKSRECPLNEFVGSLGIRFLGRRQAEIMIDMGIDTLDKFRTIYAENLAQMEGFSETKAEAIVEGLKNASNLMDNLITRGVEVIDPVKKVAGNSLSMVVCFTGVRPSKEQKEKFESLGGTVKSGVSKNLTHLVVRDVNTTSNKATKAKDLGVEVVDLDTFLGWLE